MRLPLAVAEELPTMPKPIVDWQTMFSGASDGKRVLVIVFLITAVAFVWAAFIRKRARHTHRYHHPHAPQTRRSDPKPLPFVQEESLHHRRRKRRRRRHQRKRNPTLAETGGLPPRRADEPGNASPEI